MHSIPPEAQGNSWPGPDQEQKFCQKPLPSQIDHPPHYGGADNPYEAIKVIEAWGLGFCLGNTIKYISRAGKKSNETLLEDLKKAQWYLARETKILEKNQ